MPRSRDELIVLLTEAAELEHLLCCAYLFAAFSLKRDVNEGLSWEQLERVNDWTQTVTLVARQEMEHLGLVNNLLTSIGGAPHFQRPNFPQPAKYYPQRLTLERFSRATIERFIRFEQPDPLSPYGERLGDSGGGRPEADLWIAPYPVPYRTVGDLYRLIREGIEDFPSSDRELFIGPSEAQVDGAELLLDFPRLGAMGGVFDITLFPVTDRDSALRAIELIVEQGEGTSGNRTDSHYARFQRIKDELDRMPELEPARRVVPNPVLRHDVDTPDGTLITHPVTREVMDVFNAAYETMLLLLARFYAHTDETPAEVQALRYAAFFPMMTMVIRPLGEVLTAMPAKEEGDERAGPSFEIYRSLGFLPHRRSAWVVLNERLQALASACRRLDRNGMPARLGYIAESLELMAAKFAASLRS